ncbi:hypothetical protein GCM10027256_18080 [Novispirillum itersonii subsp. nipponicum]
MTDIAQGNKLPQAARHHFYLEAGGAAGWYLLLAIDIMKHDSHIESAIPACIPVFTDPL